MKKCLSLLGMIVYLGFLGLSPAQALPTQSFTDAWDVSQGATILSNSPVHGGFDIRDMFGGNFGTTPGDIGNTIFADGYPAQTVHTVAWQTQSPVTLSGCNLFANHDGTGNGSIRSLSEFVLQYKDSSNTWQTLIDFSPPFPYMDNGYGVLARSLAFIGGPVTAQNFMAFFTQYDISYAPRIVELDAVAAIATPLPGTLVLLSSGMLGLVGWRRFRKN